MLAIRPFRSADLDALYAISLATGHEGGDASHLYKDHKLIGHIYSAPYALLEPRLALVVEDDEGVAGFAVGTPDTGAWQERLEAEWWPKLRRQYTDPAARPAAEWSADQRRAYAIHHPQRAPQQIVELYPAHLHLNLLERIQERGAGTMLFSEWMARASREGVGATHVGVNSANARGVRFWSRRGFDRLKLEDGGSDRTIWMGRS
ncbi:GNAT family N-acetyltransferase [Bradyrhizobium sp. McL0615]|uniref:GNAT family N-acetyltransferase n=1 Tax=Bradyrhizobium sp. McL0615 TaxID=3415673 RepID=UPI003CF0EA44